MCAQCAVFLKKCVAIKCQWFWRQVKTLLSGVSPRRRRRRRGHQHCLYLLFVAKTTKNERRTRSEHKGNVMDKINKKHSSVFCSHNKSFARTQNWHFITAFQGKRSSVIIDACSPRTSTADTTRALYTLSATDMGPPTAHRRDDGRESITQSGRFWPQTKTEKGPEKK